MKGRNCGGQLVINLDDWATVSTIIRVVFTSYASEMAPQSHDALLPAET
jgi:hypothetical protein